jgi:CRP-like cAMP-binding protein
LFNSISHSPNDNQLLSALPYADYQRVGKHLELTQMILGQLLYADGGTLSHLYFPTSSVISLHHEMANGSSSEFLAVGNEGAVGLSLFLADGPMSSAAMVQTGGYAYRLALPELQKEFRRAGPTLFLLLRYTQAHLSQIAQQAICKSHHMIEQKLCTWLLQRLDRCPNTEIIITQDLIADALGVRREGINEATMKLQQLGLVSCRRGHIKVLNRTQLERLTCECYASSKKEFRRLLPELNPHPDFQSGGVLLACIS